MKYWGCTLALALLLFTSVLAVRRGCEERQGCRIQLGQCLCGIGCASDYVYPNKEDCVKHLKGQKNDLCQRSPCFNGGTCIQTAAAPGYKCRCEGTGFYGSRCENSCYKPGPNNGPNIPRDNIPYECIVI